MGHPFYRDYCREESYGYLLQQRRTLDETLHDCTILAAGKHPGSAAAKSAASGIQSAVRQYEKGLSSAGYPGFFDPPRKRAPHRKLIDPALLERAGCDEYAKEWLQNAFDRLHLVILNLNMRINPVEPDLPHPTDKQDRAFFWELVRVGQRLYKDLGLIGWRHPNHREPPDCRTSGR